MIRVTTKGVLKNYRSNLNHSSNNLDSARNQVLTKRNFQTFAEDPAAATMAFRLRRAFSRSNDQLSNTKNLASKYQSAWDALETVKTDLEVKEGKVSALAGITGTAGAGRKPLGEVLVASSESVVHAMNSQFGNEFIFAGNDNMDGAPFSLEEVTEEVEEQVWRGEVDPEDPEAWVYIKKLDVPGGIAGTTGDDGKIYEFKDLPQDVQDQITADPANGWEAAGYVRQKNDGPTGMVTQKVERTQMKLLYRGVPVDASDGTPDKEKLDKMNAEASYVDIGSGLTEIEDGVTLPASAYNASISGIDLLDYGTTEVDGREYPNNAVSIMLRLGEIFKRCDPDSGEYENAQDEKDATVLSDMLHEAIGTFVDKWSELDARSNYLNDNAERLKTTIYEKNQQILDIEQVDMAQAITSFVWAQYSYNAALKVGNSILSESLMDYLN